MHYFVNMRTGESRWVDCADFVDEIHDENGDRWERKGSRCSGGMKMEAETQSPEYNRWFHSEPVQSKLKTGEYQIMPKSADMNHR